MNVLLLVILHFLLKVDKEIYAWKPIRQFWLGFHIIILQVLYLFFIAFLAPLELGFFLL